MLSWKIDNSPSVGKFPEGILVGSSSVVGSSARLDVVPRQKIDGDLQLAKLVLLEWTTSSTTCKACR